MRVPGLRTLSARILLGFAVLILTFAVVMAVTGGNIYVLTRQIRVIPDGYLQLALIGKDMVGKQTTLRDYVTDELDEESSARRARQRIRRLRSQRDRLLADARQTVARLTDVPASHRKHVRKTAEALDRIEERLAELEPLYDDLLEHGLDELVETPSELLPADLKDRQRAITRIESSLFSQMHELARAQERLVESTALGVAKNEQRVRLYAIYLGAVAVAVAVLLALWVTMTLRPLRRLQQAAQRIARGDYASRIDEKGPREVADLAHEFNLMGRAIEEREREVVRNERLAAVGKMAAMITHEVRNPLSSIALNTELLEEELGALELGQGTEARELCHSIHTEVDRLTEITEEYLKFARLPKPKLRREDINHVVTNLTGFEAEGLRQRGISLVLELAEDLPEALIDDAQLRQALLNLLRNAAEALEEHKPGTGSITLSTARDGDAIVVEVHDDGPGIPRELADKLFDPFVSTKERGTGLGLAMTHQIVLEHGGLMSVDSAPGAGTRFRMRLPVDGPESAT